MAQMLIKNGRVLTMEDEIIERGWVQAENGVITAIGEGDAPESGDCFDADGGWIMPGLFDAHCHLGLLEDSIGFEGDDCNEETDPVTPQLRVIDGINPLDRCFSESLAAGITGAVVAPGSANPVAGQCAAIKTYGRRIDDMIISAPCAMKFALGENPKRVYHDRDETPVTRMATAALIREALLSAREYLDKLEEGEDAPDFDMKHEALIPVLKREIQAHFHAHRADDIFTAIRIAKEFDLDYVIIHGTDSALVADILAIEGARVVTGPAMLDRCKPELKNQSFATPRVLCEQGVSFSICTDHPETPLRFLPLTAALAVKEGLPELEALKAMTIYPAEIAGVDGRVGSLKPGKDADIAVFSASPLELGSRVRAVFVGGVRAV